MYAIRSYYALVATEDVRFYNHSGVDLRGLIRVVKGIITGDSSSGGGVITSYSIHYTKLYEV